ncbi:hypothetical protein MTR_8g095510 [Medicago truncatula]|uniref:Uncharacterized protein n=1 Tax=Medicago truncatula TaxID=3880 RepID=G7LGI4_MEDTR|nr:hypothetical protein MTR_8g095510 [Medicago truncatula]
MLPLLANFPSSIHYYFISKRRTTPAISETLWRRKLGYSYMNETFEARNSIAGVVTVAEVIEEGEAAESRSPAMMLAGKLIDGYLSQIASMISGFNDFSDSVLHLSSQESIVLNRGIRRSSRSSNQESLAQTPTPAPALFLLPAASFLFQRICLDADFATSQSEQFCRQPPRRSSGKQPRRRYTL